MWIIRFILLGVLVTLECVAIFFMRHREKYRGLVENKITNTVLVIVYNCLYYLIVILPPAGGWNARPVWLGYQSVYIGFPVIGLLLVCAGAFLGIATQKQHN